jgi:hypothetical protein
MPLAIYTYDPSVLVYPDEVVTDLLSCVDGDPGLTVGRTDAVGVYLAYSRTRGSFGAQRIDDIVNSSFTELISVAGVDSSAYIGGSPITSYGGVTFPPSPSGEILIVYDIGMCNANGYYGFDMAGIQIDIPGYVVLFHELAHGFQLGMFGSSTEYEAITDENGLRFEDGLPLRDPSNHFGGCGSIGGGGRPPDCFIATAATAHFRGDDFRNLKWIRDFVLRGDPLSRAWFDSLFAEYDQYSARISVAMREDASLRQNIYLIAVGPLLHFYSLVRDWLMSRANRDCASPNSHDYGIAPSLAKFATECRSARYREFDIRNAAGLMHALLNEMNAAQPNAPSTSELEEPERAMAYVRDVILSTRRPLPMTQWAIVEPLVALWSLASEALPGFASTMAVQTMDRFLEDWLRRIPHSPADHEHLLKQVAVWARSSVALVSSHAPVSRSPWPMN